MRIQNEVEDALDALHSTLKDNRSVADRYHDRLVEALKDMVLDAEHNNGRVLNHSRRKANNLLAEIEEAPK